MGRSFLRMRRRARRRHSYGYRVILGCWFLPRCFMQLLKLFVALANNRLESDDDYLPDQIDGDFSVDPTRGVSDVLQQLFCAHNSIFYNQTGFTIDEWN